MRVAAGMFGAQADQRQQFGNAFVAYGLALMQPMHFQRLAEDVTHTHLGVQAGVRVLKDHLQLAAQ